LSCELELQNFYRKVDHRFAKEFNAWSCFIGRDNKPQLWLFAGTIVTIQGRRQKNVQTLTFARSSKALQMQYSHTISLFDIAMTSNPRRMLIPKYVRCYG